MSLLGALTVASCRALEDFHAWLEQTHTVTLATEGGTRFRETDEFKHSTRSDGDT